MELVAGVLALLVALPFALHVLHFSQRNATEREIWTGLWFWQPLEALEYRLLDARFIARGKKLPACHDKIAIVGVDEGSTVLGNWPLPRALHARLVRKLKAAGARVIILDFDFSHPQNPRDDAALQAAISEAGNVLLPSYVSPERKRDASGDDFHAALIYRTTTPLEAYDELTPDLALAYVPRDSDDAVRRYPLYGVINDANIGSLAALAAASYQGLLDDEENLKYESALTTRHWPTLSLGLVPVPVSAAQPSGARSDAPRFFTTPLYFWGPQQTFKTYPYADVLNGNSGEYSATALKEKFEGRIVFVGATAHILKDVFPAPQFVQGDKGAIAHILEYILPASQSVPSDNEQVNTLEATLLPGVELHATATAMLLDGTYLRTTSTGQIIWILFGLTLGASLWTCAIRGFVSRMARKAHLWWLRIKMPGQIHGFVWFGLYLVLGALPVFSFWQITKWLFSSQQLWIIVVYPALSAALTVAMVMLFLFGAENTERRKSEAHLSRLVAPEVMAELIASGEDYARPERVRLTVLFTDLEGFTTYSESHEPEQVVEVTNDYLSRMVPVIQKHGGCVDKYIGDAIMAFFGAPIFRSDHAACALRCAIEMQDECAKWRRETGIPFYMRIGIHTGEVIKGYMGSQERSDYTVIGDTVNLASRLEGKNKEFGSWIMCSAQTFNDAPDVVAAESVQAPIKGKSQAVDVFIVRGLQGDPNRDKNWEKSPQEDLTLKDSTLSELKL